MAGFDPDAYLAQKPAAAPAAFDPDAYLAAVGGGPRATGTMVDQIPGSSVKAPAATQPIRTKDFTVGERIMGALETVPALATGALTAPFVEGSKIYGALTSGQFGTQSGIRAGEEAGRKMQERFYQLRTAAGQEYVGDIGNALARTGLQGVPMNVLGDLQRGLTPAVRAITDNRNAKVAQRAESIAQQASAKDWQRAPQIEAAQKAPQYDIALNPARSNPTIATKLGVGAVGESGVNYELSQQNLPKFNKAARVDLGLPENTPLDESALNKYMERNSTSNLVIDKMGPLDNTKSTLDNLGGLMLDEKRTSDKAKFAAVNEVVSRARDQISQGLTGSEVLDQIRGFRHDAKRVLRNASAGPNEIEVAKTKLKLAKSFEKLIEDNLTDDSIIDLYRKERTAQAKGYDWERAIDPITKQVDPNQLAADVRNGLKLTGTLRDLADIAGAYPEIASMRPLATPDPYTMMRRGGAGGTIGFAALGGPEGAAVGAGLTSLAGRIAAKGMKSQGFQQNFAIPSDRRLALPPVEGLSRPNFTMADTGPYSPMPSVPNKMLGYNPNVPSTAEVQMNRLRAEDAMGQQFITRQIMAEEAQQAAAEAAARRPASGEVILDINPLTGVPEISKGLKGATPATFSDFGASLDSAAGKISAGKAFDMTAAEKVAWDKTRADLAEVAPGFKSLNDKAITAKMQDRAWVQDAIGKAQEKARAFQDIAARANTERLRQDALMKREQMLDLLETLENQFSKARPVKTGGQGPKTRAFQRNMLTPEQEIQNALVK